MGAQPFATQPRSQATAACGEAISKFHPSRFEGPFDPKRVTRFWHPRQNPPFSRCRSCKRASIGTPSRTVRKHIAPGNHCEFHGEIPCRRREIRANKRSFWGGQKLMLHFGQGPLFRPKWSYFSPTAGNFPVKLATIARRNVFVDGARSKL